MSKNINSEVLAWLKKTESKSQPRKIDQLKLKIGNRRTSVAGTSLFSVNDRVVENAVDFMGKVPREKGIIQHVSNRVEVGNSENENDNQFEISNNDEICCITKEQWVQSKKSLPALLPLCQTKETNNVETVKNQ